MALGALSSNRLVRNVGFQRTKDGEDDDDGDSGTDDTPRKKERKNKQGGSAKAARAKPAKKTSKSSPSGSSPPSSTWVERIERVIEDRTTQLETDVSSSASSASSSSSSPRWSFGGRTLSEMDPMPRSFLKSSALQKKEDKNDIPSLASITSLLDKMLLEPSSDSKIAFTTPNVANVEPHHAYYTHQTLAMSLLDHNAQSSHVPTSRRRRYVHLIFGKRLVDDRVTAEYASRIRVAVRLLETCPARPSLICFCGDVGGGNHISDAAAGYALFRQMCLYRGIDLKGIDVVQINSANAGKGIQMAVEETRARLASGRWLKEVEAAVATDGEEDEYEDDDDETGAVSLQFSDEYFEDYDYANGASGGRPGALRCRRFDVHFVLISSEYHLCNFNDVHLRSPRQSLLKPMDDLKNISSTLRAPRVNKDAEEFGYEVKPSWSFHYNTYPFIYSRNDAIAFLGKCYVLAQELTPLLVNIKGVVEKKEFFQRENYFTLTAVRRSLVERAEELHRPRRSLRIGLDISTYNKDVVRSSEGIDVVLERATASLGRCTDLVRPAGLFQRSVPMGDWTGALKEARWSVEEISRTCNPDQPLNHAEWMGEVVRGGDSMPAEADDVVEAILGGGGEDIL